MAAGAAAGTQWQAERVQQTGASRARLGLLGWRVCPQLLGRPRPALSPAPSFLQLENGRIHSPFSSVRASLEGLHDALRTVFDPETYNEQGNSVCAFISLEKNKS